MSPMATMSNQKRQERERVNANAPILYLENRREKVSEGRSTREKEEGVYRSSPFGLGSRGDGTLEVSWGEVTRVQIKRDLPSRCLIQKTLA